MNPTQRSQNWDLVYCLEFWGHAPYYLASKLLVCQKSHFINIKLTVIIFYLYLSGNLTAMLLKAYIQYSSCKISKQLKNCAKSVLESRLTWKMAKDWGFNFITAELFSVICINSRYWCFAKLSIYVTITKRKREVHDLI